MYRAEYRRLRAPEREPTCSSPATRPASSAPAVLAERSAYESTDLAERVGRLEWHPGEMLALITELARS
jgi:hypothetical protein